VLSTAIVHLQATLQGHISALFSPDGWAAGAYHFGRQHPAALVTPGRERKDATFGALADEALIVDEAVDFLEFGFQEFGEFKVLRRTVPS
jgi:hypothetical protein